MSFLFFIIFSFSSLWSQVTIIHSGKLIDGVSENPKSVFSIIVEKDKIVDVVEGYLDPGKGDKAIDLNSYTVLPDLWTCMSIYQENLIPKNIWNVSQWT